MEADMALPSWLGPIAAAGAVVRRGGRPDKHQGKNHQPHQLGADTDAKYAAEAPNKADEYRVRVANG